MNTASRSLQTRVATTALLLAVLPLAAQEQKLSRKGLEKLLRKTYSGKVVHLRVAYAANRLGFNREGKLITSSEKGDPDCDRAIRIRKISVKKKRYQMSGNRVCIGQIESDPVAIWLASQKKVRIQIVTGGGGASVADFNRVAALIFEAPPPEQAASPQPAKGNQPATLIPLDWGTPPGSVLGKVIYQIGGEISPPRCIYCPDPSFTNRARRAKFSGTVILWVIVTAEGRPEHIRITKSVGYGLDEEAVKTVRKYRFRPAMKDGIPVPVYMNIEVNFSLY